MIPKELKGRLKGKTLILGIGNTLRGDDGIGSFLAESLKHKVKAEVIDAQTAPENFLGKIQAYEPQTLVIVDAADFQGRPGEIMIFDPEQVTSANLFSTHNSSIGLLVSFLKNYMNASIIFLAIQPKRIAFNEGLSEELKATMDELNRFFVEVLS